MTEETPPPTHRPQCIFLRSPRNWVSHSTPTVLANLPLPMTRQAYSHLRGFARAVLSVWKAPPPGYYSIGHSLPPHLALILYKAVITIYMLFYTLTSGPSPHGMSAPRGLGFLCVWFTTVSTALRLVQGRYKMLKKYLLREERKGSYISL